MTLQATGREEAASLEETQCRDFCQDTSWLSLLPGDRDPPGNTTLPGDQQRAEKWTLPPHHHTLILWLNRGQEFSVRSAHSQLVQGQSCAG